MSLSVPNPIQSAWIPRILVIDDDPVSALCLQALLHQEGYLCETAFDGPQGRQLALELMPDLILLDIQMPGESGLVTCTRLKAEGQTADIPTIFITGSEDLAIKIQGFEAGAVDYVTKPFQTQEILARIRVHVRARRTMRLLMEAQMQHLTRLSEAVQSILPSPEAMPEAGFAVDFHPFHTVGGDFYDVLQAGDQIFDFVVADVCGHAADASLLTSALKVLLRQGQSTLSSPMDTLRSINTALGASFGSRTYLTLAWARLNRNRQTLTYLSAGHPAGLLLTRHGELRMLQAEGDVLGMFDAIGLEALTLEVEPGDRLILITDGWIERPVHGHVSRGQGMQRLAEATLAHRALPLADMVRTVTQSLKASGEPIGDDLLYLAVEV